MRMAATSASLGRLFRKARMDVSLAFLITPASISGDSAWTATGRFHRLARDMPSRRVAASVAGNSVMPLLHRNALKPTAPASAISSMASAWPGHNPPQSAKSSSDFSSASRRLRLSSSALRTGGSEFSGMSKKQVPPPAARAVEPVARPSQCSRPGSLKCTWASMKPGKTKAPHTSRSMADTSEMEGPTSVMTPSSTAISPRQIPVSLTNWALRRIRVFMPRESLRENRSAHQWQVRCPPAQRIRRGGDSGPRGSGQKAARLQSPRPGPRHRGPPR